jgi:hypothetical protein
MTARLHTRSKTQAPRDTPKQLPDLALPSNLQGVVVPKPECVQFHIQIIEIMRKGEHGEQKEVSTVRSAAKQIKECFAIPRKHFGFLQTPPIN